MAKKKKSTSKKKTAKKSTAKKTAARSARKSTSKKKPTPKKSAAKKTPRKSASKKKATTKKTSRKTAKKAPSRVKKTTAKKAATKKKAAPKKSAAKKAASKKATTKKASPATKTEAASKDKPARKGITIVSKKPVKKRSKATTTELPKLGGGLLSGNKKWKPLIPSGPNAAPVGGVNVEGDGSGKKRKSPFTKKQLENYKQILLLKRAELIGDVETMEDEALHGSSGGLSHTPQHLAEQGSDTYDQSLSLDLAAADRKLIGEIDEALGRIADGTYGVCVMTGKPITKERLEELPWARYSIEAAREMERRSYGR